jgi:hypothetical protein
MCVSEALEYTLELLSSLTKKSILLAKGCSPGLLVAGRFEESNRRRRHHHVVAAPVLVYR